MRQLVFSDAEGARHHVCLILVLYINNQTNLDLKYIAVMTDLSDISL